MASTTDSVTPEEEAKLNGPLSTENIAALGTTVKDLLPVPTDAQAVTEPENTETSHSLPDGPTLSHALATDDHDVKGLAQQEHPQEVLDLGWNQEKREIAEPLVGGLDNEELWMLTRRFDKVRHPSARFHTHKAELPSDKLTANVPCQIHSEPRARWSGPQYRG